MSHVCSPRRARLAEGSFCTVDSCSCGTLHVSVGAITLRLQPEVAESIWNTLGQGLQELSRERGEVAAGLELLFHDHARRGSGRPS